MFNSPLSQIQIWSGVPRASSLFDTLLVFENYPLQIPALDEPDQLRIANIRSIEQITYPLTLNITPGQQLNLRVLNDPAYLTATDVKRLLDHLHHVLDNMIQIEPDGILDRFGL